MTAEEDYKLLQYGIGFTNMVQRPTKGSADLTRKEIKDGSRALLEKIQKYQPKIVVFNGKLIFEVFSGKKDFNFGKQPETVEGTNTVSIIAMHECVILTIQIFKNTLLFTFSICG
jgi:TDG/mug DNA glycosylase family protein